MTLLIHYASTGTTIRRMAYTCLLFILLCGFAETGTAQEILDSKGREFWLTFLPNFHTDDHDDSLHIFLTSEKPTQGVIRWTDINGISSSQVFQIAKANEIFHFKIEAALHELVGFNTTGVSLPSSQNEQEAPQVFHITADDEITVYGLSQAMFSSDAFLALPQDVLGTEYIIIAYNSDGLVGVGQQTPSEFAVVATEDNTTVTIIPSVATRDKGTATQTIRLDKGVSYLVQASININLTADLTGSIVQSDKPIAVFAGHQRATIPVDVDILSSRDHLVEQLLPVATWGRSAFVVPYIPSLNEAPQGTDLYRVLAAFDGTQVSIDGVLTATLNRGGFIERPLTGAHHITATGQILVAQYRKTSGNQSGGVNLDQVSDPFMMLIPPSEQFMPSYTFVNAQGIQKDFDGNQITSYTLQYITIVIADNYRSTVKIDGTLRTDLAFSPISTTGYSYAHVRMSDGSHTITADSTFGLYVYGYGPANSYGYIGGLQLQILAKDGVPPSILSTDSCYSLFGMVYDTLSTDSRISSVEAPASMQINSAVSIAPFTPYADSVGFRARLLNMYEDGQFTMVAADSAGQRSEKEFLIPGFTVHVDSSIHTDMVVHRQRTLSTEKTLCESFTLVNYGRSVQTIDTMLFRNGSPKFSVQPPVPFPLVLAPGASREITVCFTSKEEGDFGDTLIIVDNCAPRRIAAFQYEAKDDHNAPDMTLNIDPCQTTALVSFTDSLLTDLGIESVQVLEIVNCTVTPDTADLPRMMTLRVSITDPDFDAIFTVEATDYRGNTRYFRDTIQGYTLQFVPANRGMMIYGDESRRLVHCDSVMLYNYGLLPFAVTEVYLSQNTRFSAPLSQFPLVIPPGDSAGVLVCFNPREQELYRDTLILPKYCRSIALPLQGLGVPRTILTIGDPHCGVSVVVSSSPPEDIAPVLYPNPADIGTTIRFGVRTESTVALRLSSITGNIVSASSASFDPGVYDMILDIAGLEAGVYFCEIMVGTRRTVLPLHIIR